MDLEYFFREAKVETLTLAYRKHSRLGRLVQDAIEATIVEAVERYLTAEHLFLEDSLPKPEWPRFPVEGVEDAEWAANELRQERNVGPFVIEDLCGRLEDRGVTVIAIDGPMASMAYGFDGFSCWANQRIPAIAFTSNAPEDRQRFDLVHELGHLVLDSASSTDTAREQDTGSPRPFSCQPRPPTLSLVGEGPIPASTNYGY